jgi:hypothetical protein
MNWVGKEGRDRFPAGMILGISNLTVSSRSVFELKKSHTISTLCRLTGLKVMEGT